MPDADWVLYKQMRGKPLPQTAQLLGATYTLQKTLKRDFYAATGVYERQDGNESPAGPDRIILKIYHTAPFKKLRLRWLGRLLCRREVRYLQALAGISGIPQFLDTYRSTGLVREYVPGCNLREYTRIGQPNERFFARLKDVLEQVHQRGVAHNDLSKPENILVRPDGSPVLIDFQIAAKFGWASWPLVGGLGRRMMRYLQKVDRYHLQKQHRRRRPMDFSEEQHEAAHRKGLMLTLHGWIRRPYRAVRHFVLRRLLLEKGTEDDR